MKSSFEGMEGMEGMIGLTAGGAGTAFFADRIDLPFVTVGYGPNPPIEKDGCWMKSYPVNNWSSEWYCWLVLTEFVQQKGWDCIDLLVDWMKDGHDPLRPNWTSNEAKRHIVEELRGLVIAARDERADALGEILAQSGEFVSYFLNLAAVPASYPATARLLRIANFIGGYCAMYYKGKYARPRPSMVWPSLLPPIAVPGHASFPSGHSTQAHLIWLCMGDVLADRKDLTTLFHDMSILADRIARNREIAGLHYRSDSKAGKQLACKVHALLKQDTGGYGWYKRAMDAAQAEWRDE
jgi:membrane-associated phospholipid phosphatase